jgi:hypothetical protein
VSYWFRPKRYGYGATPANWKGWLAVFAFVAVIAAIASLNETLYGPGVRSFVLAATVVATLLFLWVTWKKTDGAWRWRWGPDEKENLRSSSLKGGSANNSRSSSLKGDSAKK